ncbi:MAG: hypothetical protein J6A59_14025 [Lachnospiraceae bacterium]|nr:hypothetical protein [Lachnospiraceae bacterium]
MTIKEICDEHGLKYKEVMAYRRNHEELSIEQLIEYCSKYEKYRLKPIKEKNNIEKICEYYYLDIKLVKSYKNRHPELTEQQVVDYYIHRNIRDLKLLSKVINSTKGNKPLNIFGLDTRTYNALRRLGISTIEQLQYVPICILRNTYSIGEKSIQNIIQSCNKIGIQLREY